MGGCWVLQSLFFLAYILRMVFVCVYTSVEKQRTGLSNEIITIITIIIIIRIDGILHKLDRDSGRYYSLISVRGEVGWV